MLAEPMPLVPLIRKKEAPGSFTQACGLFLRTDVENPGSLPAQDSEGSGDLPFQKVCAGASLD
jgi:hypothetical protein